MTAWQYHRGDWREIENPYLSGDGSELGEADLGYDHWGTFGDWEETGGAVKMYCANKETATTQRWQYLAWVTTCADVASACVFLTDLPSMLSFVKEFAPVFQTQARRHVEETIEEAVKRGFHAWHGHDVEYGACMRCDPNEVRLRESLQQMRSEREAARKKAGAV